MSNLTELRRRAGLEVFLNGIPFERALLKVVAEHPELAGQNKGRPALEVVERPGTTPGQTKEDK